MDANKQAKLRGLTPQEQQLLAFFFENPELTYAQLGKKISVGAKHVGTLLTGIYKKLDIKGSVNKKKGILYQEYNEEFKALNLNAVPLNVDPLQTGLPPTPPARLRPSVIVVGVLGAFLIISVVVISVLVNIIRGLNQGEVENPIVDRPAEIAEIPTQTEQVIILPSVTNTFVQATRKPTSTPTKLPTETATPEPPQLFTDSFDNGIGPDWTINSGTWIVADGGLSLLPGDSFVSSYEWISLNQSRWQNFILSLNIYNNCTNTCNYMAIAVGDSSQKRIGVALDSFSAIYLALIGENYSDTSAITEKNWDHILPENANTSVQIKVENNTYTLTVNGRGFEAITIPGYTPGKISLGVRCDNHCPTFDDISIEPLP